MGMLNFIWIFMVVAAFVSGALMGKLDLVANAVTESAGTAVTVSFGLIGAMTLWIGLLKVLEEGGLMPKIAALLRPIMRRLFPEIPANHPAISMMVMNTAANILGMSNAATPFGLKAMTELKKLNRTPGVASNSMALFLAINTSGIVLVPTTMIALRTSLGSKLPAAIFITTLTSAIMGTIAAILVCKGLEKMRFFQPGVSEIDLDASAIRDEKTESIPVRSLKDRSFLALMLAGLFLGTFAVGIFNKRSFLTSQDPLLDSTAALWMASRSLMMEWPLLVLIALITTFAVYKRVGIYDCIVTAGKEGFDTAMRIIPYLVAVLTAVGMLRASGAIDLLSGAIDPITSLIGMPAEALPMAFLRSFTGGGSLAIAGEIMKTHGADTLIGYIVSTIYGSSETTFYVIAVYFGSIGITNGRHTLIACLIADIVAILFAVWSVHFFLM